MHHSYEPVLSFLRSKQSHAPSARGIGHEIIHDLTTRYLYKLSNFTYARLIISPFLQQEFTGSGRNIIQISAKAWLDPDETAASLLWQSAGEAAIARLQAIQVLDHGEVDVARALERRLNDHLKRQKVMADRWRTNTYSSLRKEWKFSS